MSLADPKFNESGPVDSILSAKIFWELLRAGRIKIPNQNLYLSETKLGWVIGGALNVANSKVRYMDNSVNKTQDNRELEQAIQKFWQQKKIPEIERVNKWSLEEQLCEKHFLNTVKRDAHDV